jgi:hypothetical protein
VDCYYYTFIEERAPGGRVEPVFVAGSHDLDECFEKAKKRLQDEFGELWEGKLEDCWTGTLDFVGACSPWTKQELLDALNGDLTIEIRALG